MDENFTHLLERKFCNRTETRHSHYTVAAGREADQPGETLARPSPETHNSIAITVIKIATTQSLGGSVRAEGIPRRRVSMTFAGSLSGISNAFAIQRRSRFRACNP